MSSLPRKALIFGASGQDGIYLASRCRQLGITPVTVARSEGYDVQGSVSDGGLVESLVKQHRPSLIFHLAACSTTRHDALFENHITISTGTLNILESVKAVSPESKVLIIGSGVQFRNTGNPIAETDDFCANNAYAVSRIQSVYAARYFRSLGIRAYVAYLFHHESPYRSPQHVSRMITDKVKAIRNGDKDPLLIGDTSVEKEWGFAQDIVDGLMTLVSQDDVFEAAIGTGVAYSIMDFINECFKVVGMPIEDHIQYKQGFKAEYARLVSDPSTMKRLGWTAKTDFKKLVRILLGDL